MAKDDVEFLAALGEEMRTQDTVGQADPRFWVVRHSDYEPCWDEQCDHYDLVDEDGHTVGELGHFEEDTGVLTCVPVRRVEKNVNDTLFLTLRECREHIGRNKHNYRDDAHPFAMTALSSPQVKKLWEILQEVDWEDMGPRRGLEDILRSYCVSVTCIDEEGMSVEAYGERIERHTKRCAEEIRALFGAPREGGAE